MRRRHFLTGLGAAAGASLLVAGAGPAGPAAAAGPAGGAVPPLAGGAQLGGGPPRLTPADIRFAGGRARLRYGRPQQVDLLPEHVGRVVDEAAAFMEPGPGRPAPSHPGFVVLAARDGVIVSHEARGHAVRYSGWDADSGAPVELPPDRWVAMRQDTLFDLASISKLFTATVAVRLAEDGRLDLDARVTRYLPEFSSLDPAKEPVTVRQLLTHRSGMVSWINLSEPPDHEARLAAIWASELRREPGTGHEYSDLNLITLSVLMERITGQGLPELVRAVITEPLRMEDTMFRPPAELRGRIAATEYQPGRGLVHGEVHDENAWAFDGVAGHAGLFATAHDLAVFGQMMANGGVYGGQRILAEESVRAMITNYSGPGESARGLGWQTDQRFYMDGLCSPVTMGHTGYTGTCLTVDPVQRTVLVLLTNRVHPTREWGVESDYRRAPARAFARAVPVRPVAGRTSWFAGQRDATTATLTAPLSSGGQPGLPAAGQAEFRLWYDTEPETDTGAFEVSEDGGTSWHPVPIRLRDRGLDWGTDGTFHGYGGRRWLRADAELPRGATQVRLVYRTDDSGQGRGVYAARLRVTCQGRTVFHSDRGADAARLEAVGWEESRD